MEWLNLHSKTLDSPEVIGADPTERGTWLMLLRYCIGQENGGRIDACRDWKDRKWQQLLRVTKKEVETDSDLWTWDGDCLVVTFYPNEKEAEVRAKRDIARTNGRTGGRPRRIQQSTQQETNVGTEEKPKSVNSPKAEREGEREGEGEGNKYIHIGPKRPALGQAKAAASQIGVSEAVADEWWHAREATDWTKGSPGGGQVSIGQNWQADLKTYASRMAQARPASQPPKHRQGEFAEEPMKIRRL